MELQETIDILKEAFFNEVLVLEDEQEDYDTVVKFVNAMTQLEKICINYDYLCKTDFCMSLTKMKGCFMAAVIGFDDAAESYKNSFEFMKAIEALEEKIASLRKGDQNE